MPKEGVSTASLDSASRSETTHLLPVISRPDSEHHRLPESSDSSSIFWNEVKILAQYALPVFGTHILEHSISISSVISIGHISTIVLAASSLGFLTANVTGITVIQGMSGALDTILPSLPAYSFNCISRRYFQAQGLFNVPAWIIVFVAPLNILLTYLLVWGPDSMRLWFIGAPIATSISYNLISVAYVAYGMLFVEWTAWHSLSSQCLTSLGSLARLSLGSVGQVVTEWWSWEFVGFAASLLGPITLATQSILISMVSCIFQGPFALGIAASVRIGHLLGEKDSNRAGIAVNAAQLLGILLALFPSGLLLIFRSTWGYMFNSDPVVVALVAAVLPVVALVEIFDPCGAVISGILRARGKQSLGAMLNICAYYYLGFPIGLWLVFQQNWGLFGLWWGLTIAMVCVVIVGTYLCQSTDWKKESEKVMARLAVDEAYQQRQDEERLHENGCVHP